MPGAAPSRGGRKTGRPGGRGGSDKRKFSKGGPGGGRGSRPFFKKVCRFCSDRMAAIDYKEVERLGRFLTEKGKIIPRRISGNCAKHQRMLARSIKRARHAALIAFQTES